MLLLCARSPTVYKAFGRVEGEAVFQAAPAATAPCAAAADRHGRLAHTARRAHQTAVVAWRLPASRWQAGRRAGAPTAPMPRRAATGQLGLNIRRAFRQQRSTRLPNHARAALLLPHHCCHYHTTATTTPLPHHHHHHSHHSRRCSMPPTATQCHPRPLACRRPA